MVILVVATARAIRQRLPLFRNTRAYSAQKTLEPMQQALTESRLRWFEPATQRVSLRWRRSPVFWRPTSTISVWRSFRYTPVPSQSKRTSNFFGWA